MQFRNSVLLVVMAVGMLWVVAYTVAHLDEASYGEGNVLHPITDSRLKPGQVWRYATRPGEENSWITILKLEEHSTLGRIVHLQVDGIAVAGSVIGHIPLTEGAVLSSVTEMVTHTAVPDFSDAYDRWRHRLGMGTGAVFTIGVADAIAVLGGSRPR